MVMDSQESRLGKPKASVQHSSSAPAFKFLTCLSSSPDFLQQLTRCGSIGQVRCFLSKALWSQYVPTAIVTPIRQQLSSNHSTPPTSLFYQIAHSASSFIIQSHPNHFTNNKPKELTRDFLERHFISQL